MPSSFRSILISGAAVALAVAIVAVVVVAGRPPIVLATSAAVPPGTPADLGVITSGDGKVSVKPDMAFFWVGVDSQQPTAAAAQRDLADKAARLIARAKSLGVADADTNTSGYSVSPNYLSSGVVNGYRASEQLQLKWHDVKTVGTALDALVQEGGATNVGVSFGLSDPKSVQAKARTLAIGDARSRAEAMAGAAGVKLGKVLRISDLTTSSRGAPTMDFAGNSAVPAPTQLPVGQFDVQVTVEVDFAIDG